MNMIVSTMVRITTSVAPKLRASSLRKVESNNIIGCSLLQELWTFVIRSLHRRGLPASTSMR
jgi:hypothetical protein